MTKRSPTRALKQVPDSGPALPFSSRPAGSASSRPPPSDVTTGEVAVDEDTSPATPYPRGTSAIPAIRAPDLTPSWAVTHHQEGRSGSAQEGDETTDGPAQNEAPPRAPRRAPDEVELEEYAAITSSLDHRPRERDDILEQANLDGQGYAAAKRRWRAAISMTARQGDDALMRRFDRAYVARLDEERDAPFELSDYARFDAATEMGRGEMELADQGIPMAAKMILRRHWLRRIMAEEATQRRYYEEVDRARG